MPRLLLHQLGPDLFRVHLVGLLDVRPQVGAAHVGGVAHGDGARVGPLARVRPHVTDEAVLDLELSPARGTLVLLIVAAAPLLAVLPPLHALEGLPAVRAETGNNLIHIGSIYITERQIKVCMWLRKISSYSCLTVLPGPAWVLLSKRCKPLFAIATLYTPKTGYTG